MLFTSIFSTPLEEQDINWWGLVAIIIFYIVILVVGLFASWKKKAVSQTDSEELMLAGRDIGLFVGCFTMTGIYLYTTVYWRNYSTTSITLLHELPAMSSILMFKLSSQ